MDFKPIGVIHSSYKSHEEAPIQPIFSDGIGKVEVFPEYRDGLKDLDGFSHITLLYHLHRSDGYSLHVKPYLDDTPRGLFATRAPRRPNPIGISIVKLLGIKDNVMRVEGIDALDGTPLLDIKPFVHEFDNPEKLRMGWLEGKIRK